MMLTVEKKQFLQIFPAYRPRKSRLSKEVILSYLERRASDDRIPMREEVSSRVPLIYCYLLAYSFYFYE